MSISMEQVQALDILKDSNVRTGKELLNSKFVNWVSVIETPVESFVRKNELVLTSGVGCSQNEQHLYTFVREVIDSHASALAIAIGPYVQEIPKSIIDLANEKRFILIELNWSIRFSEILEQVLELIHEEKRKYFEKIEEIRKSLLDYILSGQSLDLVAEHVSSAIECEVLIADKRGVIRGKSRNVEIDLQDNWLNFMHKQLEEDGIYHTLGDKFKWLQYSNRYALQLTIHSSGNIQGYIVVGGFGPEPFSEEEHQQWLMLLEHVTTAVAIHFLHEQAAKEAEWRLRDDFVWELSRDAIQSNESTLSRAKSLGYQINLPYICIVARPEQLKEGFHSMTHLTITFDHWLHECIRHMEEEAENIAKSMALKSMVTYQQEELIIFLEVNHPDVILQVKTYISKLRARYQFLYPTVSLTWGFRSSTGTHALLLVIKKPTELLKLGEKETDLIRCPYLLTQLPIE
ncbi:PucR family transcriptional regulator [Halalkalibacter krulwichiae]|uniref:Purine catabolism regulatory protein n=1 Tax=Halalkalibacter krulwichiae TaxID=199441 RepID=A0A1X9MAF9_9BACI|nr:PucR family transcriptional regulator ligand-binding domain-containing protein [Halalkalibacter krulwichiae]ARK30387.1 Purine catabolism regulatory protein [Halalkalibacter krulwichiae]